MRNRFIFLTLCAAIAGVWASTRLSFNVDPLDLLPGELPEVEGLRIFSEHFAGEGELIICLTLDGAEEGALETAAASLAARLIETEGLVAGVDWRPVWEEDPAAAVELPAYLWLNSSGDDLGELVASLAAGRSEEALAAALEDLSFGIDPETLAFSGYDPFGLLRPPGFSPGAQTAGAAGKYASADGSFRALYVSAAGDELNYSESGEWLEKLKAVVEKWQAEEAAAPRGMTIGYTGEPAFESEIGGGMQKDMTGSILIAVLLIHGLFFLLNRRLAPLTAIFLSLSLILSITVVTGSYLFGRLSVMSVGFAAILVGLAVDYGVVLYQEARAHPGSFRHLRKSVAPSILWAAITTAVVFASLGLSSLPGIRELGLLVALGILVGAGTMLWLFGPLAAALGQANPMPGPPEATVEPRNKPGMFFTLGLIASACVALLMTGLPGLYTGFDMLRPKNSPADDAFAGLIGRLSGDREESALSMLLIADDYAQLEVKASQAAERIRALEVKGTVTRSAFVPAIIPSAAKQKANRAAITGLLESQGRLAKELDRDFSGEAQGVMMGVFGAWRQMLGAESQPALPQSPAARQIVEQAVAGHGTGEVVMHGLLWVAEDGLTATRESMADIDGAYVTGWATLGPAVRPLVLRDLRAVFIPMAVALLVMLGIVFRNGRDVFLAIATLALSAVLLLAIMGLAGWQWDFLNVTAFPLLLGTGIDYTVHMVTSLRRHAGDPVAVRRGIGRALVFCGLSTAIGFGSLALANNAGLASLGRVCATGILITMAVAVFLLPVWWRVLHRVGDTRLD